MSEENNVCEVCGGWKYTIEFRECTPHSISVDPNQLMAPFRLCPGHPEPNGKMDEVGQICGESLCVRLDWRDPEMAQHKLEQIRSTIKNAFERAYGMYKPAEPAKEQGE